MKKICVLFSVLILCISVVVPATAAKYTDDLPSYVKISGGAYFEVFDSNLGQITCVFPVEFKDNSFCFSLSAANLPVNFVNVTNTIVYGYLYTSSGKKYSCRASRQDVIEYNMNDSGYSNYVDLDPVIAGMTNTNMSFLTEDVDYYNENSLDSEKYMRFMVAALVVLQLLSVLILLFGKGKR